MKKIAFLIGFIIVFLQSSAQKPWSLNECIIHAQEHNIQIKKQKLNTNEAEIIYNQSRNNYLPSLGINNTYNTTFGRALDPTTYEYLENTTVSDINGAISTSTDIFSGLRKYHTLRRSKLSLRSAIQSNEKAKNDLALNITAAYLEILFAEDNYLIATNKLAILKQQEQKTKQLVEAGKNIIGDLLQIQAQNSEAEHDILTADNRKTLGYLSICQLLEIEDYRNFKIEIPQSIIIVEDESSLGKVEDIFNAAQQLPEIKFAQLQIQIAEKDVSIAKASLYPTLNLSGGYGSTYSDARQKLKLDENRNPVFDEQNQPVYTRYPFEQQMKDNASGYISLNLSIPIFNSMKAFYMIPKIGIM